jgi:hypothetical protein
MSLSENFKEGRQTGVHTGTPVKKAELGLRSHLTLQIHIPSDLEFHLKTHRNGEDLASMHEALCFQLQPHETEQNRNKPTKNKTIFINIKNNECTHGNSK